MAGGGQMALPMERRNGASPHPPGVDELPSPELAPALPSPAAGVDGALWVRRVTTAAVVLVAVVAAVAGYEHMRELAEGAGEGWRSWLMPVSVDGLAVAASMTMLVRRRAGLAAGALAWVALLGGLGRRWRRTWRRPSRLWRAGS